MKNPQSIYQIIKQDYCSLLDYKLRGNTLELLTNVSTIGSSFISVFVSWDGEKYIASDGGWISEKEYVQDTVGDQETVDRIISQYINYYSIKSTLNKVRTRFYYKTCAEIEMLSGMVHDLSMFIQGVVNAQLLNYEPAVDEVKQSQQFGRKVNTFMRSFFGEASVHTNHVLKVDENQKVKLNAFVQVPYRDYVNSYLMMYITGYRKDIFVKDITKATVIFQIIAESKRLSTANYKRIAIVNSSAAGYEKKESAVFMRELAKFTNIEPLYLDDNNMQPSFLSIESSLPKHTIL